MKTYQNHQKQLIKAAEVAKQARAVTDQQFADYTNSINKYSKTECQELTTTLREKTISALSTQKEDLQLQGSTPERAIDLSKVRLNAEGKPESVEIPPIWIKGYDAEPFNAAPLLLLMMNEIYPTEMRQQIDAAMRCAVVSFHKYSGGPDENMNLYDILWFIRDAIEKGMPHMNK